MNQPLHRDQFVQQAQPMLEVVDAMFGKIFAPQPIRKLRPNSDLPHVTVTHEGIEWCVAGSYCPAEEDVGISASEYQAEVIWFTLDPESNNVMDILTQSTIDRMEEAALQAYEGNNRDELAYAIEQRKQAIRDESLAERE